MSHTTLLTYAGCNKYFKIHTNATDIQLGAIISQNGKPIAFYSRKLTGAQIRYKSTEKELLRIVEALRQFRTILLAQILIIYTDHKNLTVKHFNTERDGDLYLKIMVRI